MQTEGDAAETGSSLTVNELMAMYQRLTRLRMPVALWVVKQPEVLFAIGGKMRQLSGRSIEEHNHGYGVRLHAWGDASHPDDLAWLRANGMEHLTVATPGLYLQMSQPPHVAFAPPVTAGLLDEVARLMVETYRATPLAPIS